MDPFAAGASPQGAAGPKIRYNQKANEQSPRGEPEAGRVTAVMAVGGVSYRAPQKYRGYTLIPPFYMF